MTQTSAFLLQIEDARAVSFVDTRSRRTDSESSRKAAKNATSGKAARQRAEIQRVLKVCGPLTPRQIAEIACEDYYDIQRRMSETANIRKNGQERDDGMVWEWVG